MWRASLICAHCGGGVLEALKDSGENERKQGIRKCTSTFVSTVFPVFIECS